MDKKKFIENFQATLRQLKELTSQYCFNEIHDEFEFILVPSQRTESNHLSTEENAYLKEFDKLKDKKLQFGDVVELFYKNGKVPKWIDSEIYATTNGSTIVRLLFSRQFKNENEIYYMNLGTGPFKAIISFPPEPLKKVREGKFDLNWQEEKEKQMKGKI